jgi:hypothetical protein
VSALEVGCVVKFLADCVTREHASMQLLNRVLDGAIIHRFQGKSNFAPRAKRNSTPKASADNPTYSCDGEDVDRLRGGRISIEPVLELVNYRPMFRHGEQQRGPCPFHSTDPTPPCCFSVNLVRGLFRCFHCHAQRNPT